MKLSLSICAGLLLFPATGVFAQGINDAEIAAIVVVANQVDIDAGRLATARATNSTVKAFAERMVGDHTGVNKSAVELVTKLKVTPQDNATSQSLQTAGEKNVAALESLEGSALDKAYVDHEVAYHTQVLEALDKILIPNSQNVDLKALLVRVRPAFVAHLNHAKHLQASLSKGIVERRD